MSSKLSSKQSAIEQQTSVALQPLKPIKADQFGQLYELLNDEQRQAVDAIEGPVMVIAGPGTGKTQILTLRIANILRRTQMNPRNILALTFTDSAANNMRRRLVEIIGPAGYGVTMTTFHGFANQIIGEFAYKFQFAKELRPIDAIEQIEIVEQLLDRLPLDVVRPPRMPHHYLNEIIARISDLKKEGISPEALEEICQLESDRLGNSPESFHTKGAHKGKVKAAVLEEMKHLARCRELALIYRGYQDDCLTKGLYDYDDMILFVINQLENDEELKAYYQERYQYILVDEYQDTNNSQNRLIELLSDYFETPNLFVVGDDKQSIFRFQGASTANLMHFYRRYPMMKIISLRKNYRSVQPILNSGRVIIDGAKERITRLINGVDDQLESVVNDEAEVPAVKAQVYSSSEIERFAIVEQIGQLIDRGVAASEIALIYKQNNEAIDFADLLSRRGITFTLEKGSDVLADADIRRLLTTTACVAEPTNSAALFAYLHYDFTAINGLDLLQLTAFRAKEHISFLDAVNRHQEVKLGSPEKIARALERMAEWRLASVNHSMPELIEMILNQSGLMEQIKQSQQRVERLHRLSRFFDEIKRLATVRRDIPLTDLLDHFQRMIENNIQLVPVPLELGRQAGAVRLMTAHRSKGLEFSYVFIPNLIDKHWGNDSRTELIKLPGRIIGDVRPDQDEKNEDDRRLLFVAMTRAKKALYLSYAKSHNGREKLPSQFWCELAERGQIKDVLVENNERHIVDQQLARFAPLDDTLFGEREAEYLRELIREMPLTPTGLNNYLTCPKSYLYKNILRIPAAKEASQAYGTAIHAAMQGFFMRHKATKQIPTLEELLGLFDQALTKEIISQADLRGFTLKGHKVLTSYYERHLRTVTPTVAVEYSFDSHHVTQKTAHGDIWLTGRLDKLELLDPTDNSVRVIDYKTGRAKTRNEIEGKTADADGNYKRQLVFYQLLADADKQFIYKVRETGLAFVDDDQRFNVEKFTISQDEVEDLRRLIDQVFGQMLNLEFPHVENPKRQCEFCDI